MPDSERDPEAITTYLRHNAIPLRHVEFGRGFDDLQPLKHLWRDAQVIGLGESTHGTREFFQIKHRLLEFLVSEMNFTVFAMEASHTACEPVDAWVKGGQGDLDTLLSGIHYLAWHTEEFVALVEWLRTWNRDAPADRTVTFLGTDVTYNERGRNVVLEYLGRVAQDRVDEAQRIFNSLAAGEAKWPLAIDDRTGAAVAKVLPALDDLVAWLNDNRDALVARSSGEEIDRVCFYLGLMSQWWRGGAKARTAFMGENLIHLLDRDHPGARAMYWAHNGHVDAWTHPDGVPKAGHRLRERFGDGYYACALEFGEGSYQYRHIEPGGTLGELRIDTVGPPLQGSVPWHLARANVGNALVHLRVPAQQPAVRSWLDTPQLFHGINWAAPAPQSTTGAYEDVTPGPSFDGLLFIERSTPVRATTIALNHAARHERM